MNNFSTNTNSIQEIHGKQLMKLYQDTILVHNFQHVLKKNKTYPNTIDIANEFNHIFMETGPNLEYHV